MKVKEKIIAPLKQEMKRDTAHLYARGLRVIVFPDGDVEIYETILSGTVVKTMLSPSQAKRLGQILMGGASR